MEIGILELSSFQYFKLTILLLCSFGLGIPLIGAMTRALRGLPPKRKSKTAPIPHIPGKSSREL